MSGVRKPPVDWVGDAFVDTAGAADELLDRRRQTHVEFEDDAIAVPAGLREDAGMLGAQHQDGVETDHQLVVMDGLQLVGERVREALGCARQLIDDAARALPGEDRDGVDLAVETALPGERSPWRLVVRFGEGEAQLAGVAVRGAIDLAGSSAADVPDDELERAPDRGVGPIALPQGVDAGVHADLAGARPAAHQDRPDRHRRGEEPVHVELVVAHGFDRGEHPGQVLGETARHHGGDRDLLDRGVDEVGWDVRDDVVGRPGRCRRAS